MVSAASSELSGKKTGQKQQQALMIGHKLINTADTDVVEQRVKTTLIPSIVYTFTFFLHAYTCA